jgi:hypothetical protein
MRFADWWFWLLGKVEKSDFFEKIGLLGRSHLDNSTLIRSLSPIALLPYSPIPPLIY